MSLLRQVILPFPTTALLLAFMLWLTKAPVPEASGLLGGLLALGFITGWNAGQYFAEKKHRKNNPAEDS